MDLPKKTFVSKFKLAYKKVRKGERGKQEYQFENCKLVGKENDAPTNIQTKIASGYGIDSKKTLNSAVSRHNKDCIHILYRKLIWKKYNNENSIIKENTHDLDTENNDQKPSINQGDTGHEAVSTSSNEEDSESYGIPDSDFDTDFYRIKVGFQYSFLKDGKTVKVICAEGDIKKLSNKTAILHRACIEKACPEGHYDSVKGECIPDMGGANNE